MVQLNEIGGEYCVSGVPEHVPFVNPLLFDYTVTLS